MDLGVAGSIPVDHPKYLILGVTLKKFIFLLQYWIVRAVSALIYLLPFRLALAIAKPIGHLLFLVLRRPRRQARENLRNAFPEKSEQEIKAVTKESFVHLAEFGIEWLKMPEMIDHPNRYLIETVPGKEKIEAELKKGRGAVILVTHTANWEVMALIMGRLIESLGSSVYAVARPFKNLYLYQYAMTLRAGQGLKTIHKDGGVREVFDRLKENNVVCILIDQRVSEGSIETNFFGRPALTTSLPIMAALRLGTPIFFSFLSQTKDLRYEMKLEGPVSIVKTESIKKDILANTYHFTLRVEEEIRRKPSGWLWMHNRWRVPHGPKD